jgi:putative ABC transport system ATP-binding protein
MNEIGGLSEQKVEAFLALFENDSDAAIAAIKQHQSKFSNETGSLDVEVTTSFNKAPISFEGDPIISVQSVTKSYKMGKRRVEAIQNVSLEIYPGEIVAIVGPSGSGKSTLLQILGCLDTPTTGSVVVDGNTITHMRDGALSELRRSTIGFIFQSFYLQPFLRLGDNVSVPAMFTSKKRKDINSETTQLLDTVDLLDRRNHYPKELSGGQVQRAAIARALINQPKIILADEPTGNLDSKNSEAIIEVFKNIRDRLGTTIIVVTHNNEVASMADRVIQLKDGSVV